MTQSAAQKGKGKRESQKTVTSVRFAEGGSSVGSVERCCGTATTEEESRRQIAGRINKRAWLTLEMNQSVMNMVIVPRLFASHGFFILDSLCGHNRRCNSWCIRHRAGEPRYIRKDFVASDRSLQGRIGKTERYSYLRSHRTSKIGPTWVVVLFWKRYVRTSKQLIFNTKRGSILFNRIV